MLETRGAINVVINSSFLKKKKKKTFSPYPFRILVLGSKFGFLFLYISKNIPMAAVN